MGFECDCDSEFEVLLGWKHNMPALVGWNVNANAYRALVYVSRKTKRENWFSWWLNCKVMGMCVCMSVGDLFVFRSR